MHSQFCTCWVNVTLCMSTHNRTTCNVYCQGHCLCSQSQQMKEAKKVMRGKYRSDSSRHRCRNRPGWSSHSQPFLCIRLLCGLVLRLNSAVVKSGRYVCECTSIGWLRDRSEWNAQALTLPRSPIWARLWKHWPEIMDFCEYSQTRQTSGGDTPHSHTLAWRQQLSQG